MATILGLFLFTGNLAAGTLPSITLTVPDGSAAESGRDPASFTVTRTSDAGLGSVLHVYLQLGGSAANGADFTTTNLLGAGGSTYFVQIQGGQLSRTVTLTPNLDNLIEGEENITFQILPPQQAGHEYTIGDPSSGQATIADDVAEVHLAVDDPEASEAGQDPASFTVTRNGQGNMGAVLNVYLQLGGSAANGVDFTTTNLVGAGGSTYFVQIQGGQLSRTVTLTPIRDNLIEGEENITFNLLAPQQGGHHYTIGAPSMGASTIADDVASITITAPDALAEEEGQDTATFTITRTDQANTSALLNVYLQLGGTATISADYVTTNLVSAGGGTYFVQIQGGTLSRSVVVTPSFDEIAEGDETVSLTVVAPQSAGHDYQVGMPSHAVVTILDYIPAIMKDGFENLAR